MEIHGFQTPAPQRRNKNFSPWESPGGVFLPKSALFMLLLILFEKTLFLYSLVKYWKILSNNLGVIDEKLI